jgi:hypothetical protein
MRRISLLCSTLVLPAFTVGCGAAGPREAGVIRTDSAGVAIV